jgi:hypothetical protein
MPELAHFYHVWADGAWQVPVHEHFKALRESDFPGSVHVGVTGLPGNRNAVEQYIGKFWSWNYDRCASADKGFEQVTLDALRDYVHRDDAAPYVLYAHTKGAFVESSDNCRWREAMTRELVQKWGDCVPLLEGNDAVGMHWLTSREFPGITSCPTSFPFFGGNFWWATTCYLRTLPEVSTTSRYDAEAWIGRGKPRVHNLKPGWPFYPETAREASLRLDLRR